MTEQQPLIKTLTGELFLPIRLYYKLHSRQAVETIFHKLRCMENEGERWLWLLTGEAKKLPFSVVTAPKGTAKGIKNAPIVLGTVYFANDQQMIIDVGSVARAVAAVPFFANRIKRDLAEITHHAIYNKLFTDIAEHPGDCFDRLFAEVSTDQIDARAKGLLADFAAQVAAGDSPEPAKGFELVEGRQVHYYESGIKQMQLSLHINEMIAVRRATGEPDFTLADAIQSLLAATKRLPKAH